MGLAEALLAVLAVAVVIAGLGALAMSFYEHWLMTTIAIVIMAACALFGSLVSPASSRFADWVRYDDPAITIKIPKRKPKLPKAQVVRAGESL